MNNTNPDEIDLQVEVSLYFGPALTAFNHEYRNKEKFLLLKSDIETDDYMVAVSLEESDLDTEMRKYDWINKNVHQAKKQIILVAPNYSDEESIQYLRNELNIQIVKNIQEAF